MAKILMVAVDMGLVYALADDGALYKFSQSTENWVALPGIGAITAPPVAPPAPPAPPTDESGGGVAPSPVIPPPVPIPPIGSAGPALPPVQAVAAAFHKAWCAKEVANGKTSFLNPTTGEELLVDYDKLSAAAQSDVLWTVNEVYAAIAQLSVAAVQAAATA